MRPASTPLPRCALCQGDRWKLEAGVAVRLECQQCGLLYPGERIVAGSPLLNA